MSRRTQITLTDAQYAFLKREAKRSGLSLAELVRRALSAIYGSPGRSTPDALRRSFGVWKNRDFDGEQYVEATRRGLGRRLSR